MVPGTQRLTQRRQGTPSQGMGAIGPPPAFHTRPARGRRPGLSQWPAHLLACAAGPGRAPPGSGARRRGAVARKGRVHVLSASQILSQRLGLLESAVSTPAVHPPSRAARRARVAALALARSAHWRDVLVEPEEIRGIVRGL